MTWIAFIAFEVIRNFALIKWLKLKPHYGWSTIIRFFSGIGYLFAYYPDPLTMGFPPWNYALFQITSFYLLFDLTLNFLRGKRWDYRGKDSGVFFDKLSKRKYYLLKGACLVIFGTTIYLLYVH